MSKAQLIFPFPQSPRLDAESYVVLPSNHLAHQAVHQLASEGAGLVLYGVSGVGKSHLAYIYSHLTGVSVISALGLTLPDILDDSYIVEDLEKADAEAQEALFHIFNHVKTVGGKLLVTSNTPVAQMDGLLPDLKSRLLTLPQIEIEEPKDAHLEVLLVKFASDRQLQIEPQVFQYILKRSSRNINKLQYLMEVLDELSIQRGRKITVALVREVLESA